jgi:hypothetical protein
MVLNQGHRLGSVFTRQIDLDETVQLLKTLFTPKLVGARRDDPAHQPFELLRFQSGRFFLVVRKDSSDDIL